MSWEGSDRKERLPENWQALRAARLKKDGYRCTWIMPSGSRCPRRATDVDHKREKEDDHRIEALQSLCAHHHGKKTAKAAAAFKRAKRASRRRPPEEHPGRVR